MFDSDPSETMQRVRGRAEVRIGAGGRLERLYQSGSAKALMPRPEGAAPEVVLLNTAGGLTGGDRLDYALGLGAGARLVATTQAAERVYDAAGGRAEVRVTAEVGAGACLHWLPQETILYDRAALDRRTEVALGPGASCLLAESIVLGRAAMGETVRRLALHDSRRVSRGGVPVAIDALALDDAALADAGPAGLSGARALGSVLLVDDGAEAAAAALRPLLEEPGVDAAASGWDGRTVVRALAVDGFPLRRLMARVLSRLAGGLPRVWQT